MPLQRLLRCTALVLGLFAAGASAQGHIELNPYGLRGDVTGTWSSEKHAGQGVHIEVIDRGRAVMTWYTFDADGAPLWLFGLGVVDGVRIRADVSRVEGGRFPAAFESSQARVEPWGELGFEFLSCNEGTLTWNPSDASYAAGSMSIKRVTSVHGVRCGSEEAFGEVREFAFELGAQGFVPLFADYPSGEDEFHEIDFRYEALPAPLGARRGLRLTGNNHSDDLAMLVKRQLSGLAPSTRYRIELEMEVATNVPFGCFGIGGSPGEDVFLRMGASTLEPVVAPTPDGMLRLTNSIDFGQQSENGINSQNVGVLANSYSCSASIEAPWELKTVSTHGKRLIGETDAQGRLWVLAGSDSGFEGLSRWYLTALRVRLRAMTTE